MKKILTLLPFLFLIFGIGLIAQPTFIHETLTVTRGDNFCMEVKTKDFTDILSIEKTFMWDSRVIRYTGVNTPFMTNVSGFPAFIDNNFDASDAANGKLVWSWRDTRDIGFTIPDTFEDDYVLFEMCFEAIGTFGKSTPISTAQAPPPVVTRSGTGGINIGCYSVDGLVGTDVLPVKFLISSPEPGQGDFFDVEVRVQNFFGVGSAQFTIEYDPAVVEPNGIGVSNHSLPGWQPAGWVSNPIPGFINMSWQPSNLLPHTLPNDTLAFTINFRAIGDCEDYSFIKITSGSTPLIITSGFDPDPNAGTNIAAVVCDGLVRVKPCDLTGGIGLSELVCPEAMPGETVCVEIIADGFDDLTEADFLIKFNPAMLKYQSSTFPTAFQPTLGVNAANLGTLSVKWKSRTPTVGITVPDGSKIIELCFEVIGDGTVENSPIAFTGSPQPYFTVKGSNTNVGLIATNGCVKVKAPPGLTLSADEYEGFKGEQICVDVTSANFSEINQLAFSINYAANVVRFDAVQNIHRDFMGFTAANITDMGSGALGVNWDVSSGGGIFGITIPSGEVLFTICFTIIGDPTMPPLLPNCSIVEFSNDPVDINVMADSNSGFNIGINSNPGNICVKDPGAFTVTATDVTGDLNDRVCVDVEVANCNEITSFQFSTNWNNNFGGAPIVDFSDVEVTGAIPGLTQSSFGFRDTDLGLLTVSWNGPAITLNDGTSIFRVCFNIIGPPLQCTDFDFDENPLPVYVTSELSGANDIGLTSEPGSICTNDYFRIEEAVIIGVGCPGANDGTIFLNTRGGTAPYTYAWDNNITDTDNSIANLAPGIYTVTMTDSGTPQVTVIDSFEITISGTAPMADAGTSVSMNCNNLPVELDGTSSSAGSEIAYLWTTPDGGLVSPSDETSTPRVTSEGMYVLEVLNTRTQCVAYDTVMVTPPVSDEGADAGEDQLTNCFITTARLDGTNSVGDNLLYSWSSISGQLDPATDSLSIATALIPGDYVLTVINRATGCFGKDTVRVFQDDIAPTADAGPGMSIPCRADTITIGGTNTTTNNVTYEWITLTGGNIISSNDESAVQVNAAGIYQLAVLDTLNGCRDTSEVEVIGDPNRPVADAGPQLKLDCRVDSVQIQSQLSSQQGAFEYTWEALAGGILKAGEENILQPTVKVPGRYQLTVRNLLTGCESFSSVSVVSDKRAPVAFAGSDFDFQCNVIPIILDGSGSSVFDSSRTAVTYDYLWTNDNGANITNPTELVTTASDGTGEFILQVTNVENGCVAFDTMMVTQDTSSSIPNVVINPVNQMITCLNEEVTLNAIGSDADPNLTIVWAPAANILRGIDGFTPTVDASGEYTLTLFNEDTGCANTKKITVSENIDLPFATVTRDSFELPCDPAEVQISGFGSDQGSGIIYNWSHSNPAAISQRNSIEPIVTEVGIYTLTVSNQSTGCEKDTSLVVYPAPSNIVADAGDDLGLDCNDDEFEITGGNSSTDPGLNYFWVDQMSGDTVATTLNWTVRDAGTFVLTVKDDKGCFDFDEISVERDTVTPIVNVGGDQTFDCNFEDALLSGTFDAQGANATILWTSPDGNPITGEMTETPTVTEAGEYIFTVTNTDNGCSDEKSVTITVNSANLEEATADFDVEACEDFAMLTANLPANATGIWTTPAGASITDPTDPMTTATDLPAGTFQFIWTLSTADCPDYSSDNVTVTISAAADLTLRSDVVLIDAETDTTEIDYIRNDDFDLDGNWTIRLLDTLPTGTILSQTDGAFMYLKEDGFEGSFDLTYEVCNLDCPDLCDTATIKIRVSPDMSPPPPPELPPNAITPNGDGLNETLVFTELENTNEEFPDNELTVFNRWGDIVHKSRPYNNDWAGTGRNGKPLPQATYYYILRLNVSEGIIIRGDVTILK